MSTKFITPSAVSAEYFRPGDHRDAFAVVLEPREVIKQGANGKPEVLCSAVIFDEGGKVAQVIEDTIVNVGVIYRQLVRALDRGAVLAGYVDQGTETGHGTKPWVIRDLDPAEQELVVRRYEALNAEVAA